MEAASRIQSATAKAGNGMVQAGSFAARAMSAAARNAAAATQAAGESTAAGSSHLPAMLTAATAVAIGIWFLKGESVHQTCTEVSGLC